MIVSSHQEMIQLDYKVLTVPRRTFTWLDDTFLVVTSKDQGILDSDCLALNTVSPRNFYLVPFLQILQYKILFQN